jgi:hypothetical protein
MEEIPRHKVTESAMDVAGIKPLTGRVALLDGACNVPDAGEGIAILRMKPIEDKAKHEGVLSANAAVVWQQREELELGFKAFGLGEPGRRVRFSFRHGLPPPAPL